MKLACVKCIFRFTFKSRAKRRNEKQKIIFNAKDNLVRNHSFMKSAKNSEIRTPTLHPYPTPPPLSTNIQFWSELPRAL